MLQQEQQIGNPAGAALFDELALKFQRVGVGDCSEAPDFEYPAALDLARARKAGLYE